MSEPIPHQAGESSTPPPPPPPPAPASTGPKRTRLFVILGVVVALVVAAGVTGFLGRSSATETAKDYQKAIAAWNKKELPQLIDSATTLPDHLYPSGDVTSDKSLDSQREVCTGLKTKQGEFDDDFTPPSIDGSAFGFLSGAYGDTKDEADTWAATLKKFRDRTTDHLTATVADCTLQIAYHEKRAVTDKAWDEVKKYLDRYQQVQVIGNVEWTCNYKDGCRPVASDKFTSYVAAYHAYLDAEAEIADVMSGDVCTSSSLGKDGCAAVAAVYSDDVENDTAWLKLVEDAGPTGHEPVEDKISAADDKSDKLWDENWAAFGTWAAKTYPELEDEDWFKAEDVGVTQVLWFVSELRREALEKDAPEVD